MQLPKPYLSYSALSLWDQNKKRYRQQYYLGYTSPSSPELRAGSRIHKLYEDDDPSLDHLPRYDLKEVKFQVEIDGVPILGFIDRLDSKNLAYLDLKTGKKPWTEKQVKETKQLPFYALALSAIHDQWEYNAGILWIETCKKPKEENEWGTYDHTIELTGRHEWYPISIDRPRIQETREWLVSTAHDISVDYTEWLKSNGI